MKWSINLRYYTTPHTLTKTNNRRYILYVLCKRIMSKQTKSEKVWKTKNHIYYCFQTYKTKHTHRKKSDWLFIIANWQSHEKLFFCTMAFILYFICVRLRILGIFKNYTNFHTHMYTLYKMIQCGTFYVLFFLWRIALFCLSIMNINFQKKCIFASHGMRGKPKNFIKWICLYKHTGQNKAKTNGKINNNRAFVLTIPTNIKIYDISFFCSTSEK